MNAWMHRAVLSAVLLIGVNDVTGAGRTATRLARQRPRAALLVQRYRVKPVLFSRLP